MVEAVHIMGEPPRIVLGRHNQQLRESLQHPAKDDARQRPLHLVEDAHGLRGDLTEVYLALLALAGDDMQGQRHVQLRGRLPEWIVLLTAVRSVRWRRPPDHRAFEA